VEGSTLLGSRDDVVSPVAWGGCTTGTGATHPSPLLVAAE
jgi:hypothetical protein